MSDKKQWQLPKVREKKERRDVGNDLNPNKEVHAGDVHDLLTSHMSKPVSRGCTLPKICNGQLMRKHTSITKDADRGKVVSTHFPSLPVKAVSQQQVRILSKRSSPSLDFPHSRQEKHGFDEFKLPAIAAIVKQGCGSKVGSHLRQDGLSTHLPPIQTMTQASCQSAGHRPIMAVLKPTTEQHSICKLPVIKNTAVKYSRPKSVNLHRLPCVLPPIGAKEHDGSFTLPTAANMQKAETLRKDKAKKNKKTLGMF